MSTYSIKVLQDQLYHLDLQNEPTLEHLKRPSYEEDYQSLLEAITILAKPRRKVSTAK